MPTCARCGSENKDRAVLCSNCGAVLDKAPSGARNIAAGTGLADLSKGPQVTPSRMTSSGGTLSEEVGTRRQSTATGRAQAASRGAGPQRASQVSSQPAAYSRQAQDQLQARNFAAWAPRSDIELSQESADWIPMLVGPTTLGLIVIAALLFFGAAATPVVVATLTDQAGTVTTVLRYSPLDSTILAAAGVFVLLGRRRGWTILRLLIALVLLTAYLVFRRVTFGHLPIDIGDLAIQHVRLGPAWYLAALGTAFSGAGFVTAVRGHF